MAKSEPPIVKRSLFSWIFAGNLKYQILLLIVIIVMVGARVLPLEMQKRIVNEAINLGNIELLFRYCGLFFAAVVFSSALKYLTNIIQTLITQRTTARMRKELYHHILPLPLNFFRKTPILKGFVLRNSFNEPYVLSPARHYDFANVF